MDGGERVAVEQLPAFVPGALKHAPQPSIVVRGPHQRPSLNDDVFDGSGQQPRFKPAQHADLVAFSVDVKQKNLAEPKRFHDSRHIHAVNGALSLPCTSRFLKAFAADGAIRHVAAVARIYGRL